MGRLYTIDFQEAPLAKPSSRVINVFEHASLDPAVRASFGFHLESTKAEIVSRVSSHLAWGAPAMSVGMGMPALIPPGSTGSRLGMAVPHPMLHHSALWTTALQS